MRSELDAHCAMQNMARETMAFLADAVRPGMKLTELRRMAEDRLRGLGADAFWYWDVGAFVFAGEETTLSVSGRTYRTSDRVIAETDIITVDLSPSRAGVWGDFARTLIVEDGRAVADPAVVRRPEWREGLAMEQALHEAMCTFVTPDTTFEQLYLHINAMIADAGWVNLDFLGNLGHSIVARKQDRIYTERGNTARLGDAGIFTFEPHISRPGGAWGYKMEDVYAFDDGRLCRL